MQCPDCPAKHAIRKITASLCNGADLRFKEHAHPSAHAEHVLSCSLHANLVFVAFARDPSSRSSSVSAETPLWMQLVLSAASLVTKKPFCIPQLLRATRSRSSTRPNGEHLISTSCVLAAKQALDMAVGAGSPVAGLEPANVWAFFQQLTQIPRPSKHEEK